MDRESRYDDLSMVDPLHSTPKAPPVVNFDDVEKSKFTENLE